MSTVIAIHWTQPALQFVVAQEGHIEKAASVAVEPSLEPAAIGSRLAAALAPYSPGRAKVLVALNRGALEWQHLSLPPCTADELSDVVRLQADRDQTSSDEDLGFDFLSLAGDEQTPYQVLTVALAASELTKIRQACQAANLTLERLVPLAAGWPAITRHAANQTSGGSTQGTQIYVAPLANEATLWAIRAGRVVLFRQFQLATAEDPVGLAPAVGSELRRTLLAMSQHSSDRQPVVFLVGHQQGQLTGLASTLNEQLEVDVQSLDVTAQLPDLSAPTSSLPLAGFAMDESQGSQPLVDLLHPHQRPKKQVDLRTYALAAAASILLLTLFGWYSYAKLTGPLKRAAADQAELTILEQQLDELNEYEQRAVAIRNWNAETPNLLLHIQQISQCFRPQTLDAEGFAVDQDVVLDKLHLDKRQLNIDALARNSRAVTPLENRLRAADYGAQRGKSDLSKTLKDYPWHFKSTIEITADSDTVGDEADSGVANSATAEEPQS